MSDLISRQAALEAIRTMQTYKLYAGDDMLLIDQAEAQTELMMLPPVQPDPCEDAVSREAVLSMIDTYMNKSVELHYLPTSDGIKKLISILPIVTPKLRKETSDLIRRQTAVDALCKSECGWNNAECRHKNDTDFSVTCDNVKIIKSLPSAQPDIIRCKDCKYSRVFGPCSYCYEMGGEIIVPENGFCFKAERREDETD